MSTNHFKRAEQALTLAEKEFDNLNDNGYPEGDMGLTRAHYYLQFANAHTILAQVQAQTTVYGSVDKMADAMIAEDNNKKENN